MTAYSKGLKEHVYLVKKLLVLSQNIINICYFVLHCYSHSGFFHCKIYYLAMYIQRGFTKRSFWYKINDQGYVYVNQISRFYVTLTKVKIKEFLKVPEIWQKARSDCERKYISPLIEQANLHSYFRYMAISPCFINLTFLFLFINTWLELNPPLGNTCPQLIRC